jgi:hypothetical protein
MQKEFDNLILSGALEPAGIDSETGEMLYSFTNKLKDVSPELYNETQKMINREIMGLWEKGFIDVDLMDDDPMARLTLKASDPEEVKKLSNEERHTLKEIIRICSN